MKFNSSILAPLVIAAFFGIIFIGNFWELPSMQKQFSQSSGEIKTVNIIVNGLHCRGTSNFFMKIVGDAPGVVSISTFVQEHRAEIKYDPSKTDPEKIGAFIEKPVKLHSGNTVKPFTVTKIME